MVLRVWRYHEFMNERHSPTNVPRNGPTPRRRRAGVQNAFSKHAPFPRRARMRCLSMCCSDQAAGRFIDHVCKRDCSLLTHQTDHVQIGPSRQSQESDQTIDLRGGDFCTMTPCRVKTGGVCGRVVPCTQRTRAHGPPSQQRARRSRRQA